VLKLTYGKAKCKHFPGNPRPHFFRRGREGSIGEKGRGVGGGKVKEGKGREWMGRTREGKRGLDE